ncbi:hypothetical protein BX661DRAFT_184168 [Kickxella alabastrina]|uniref:uncharacterized protein n=1 Tax=Kickxella alabastrina TaxID=61397 RepID=UPI00221E69DA|nr:uncharacterized protein BX661DRAFT_184168 [Kickxella alabastrina]KAI7825788.1 hypothetical protein BX661DRAFT_184168 [Kickxella alabastrina]
MPLKIAPAFTPRHQKQQQQDAQRTGQTLPKKVGQVATQLTTAFTKASLDDSPAAASSSDRNSMGVEDDFVMTLPQGTSQTTFMKPIGHFAIDENLRRLLVTELHTENEVVESGLPFQIHKYHSLSPLETVDIFDASGSIKVQAMKAQSIVDGRHYTLHRITSAHAANQAALGEVDKWKLVQNPSIAQVHEAFTTRAFGDSSLIIVRDYKPLASSLKVKVVDSPFLWSIVLQLTSALRAVHSAGLAVHTLSVSTVILSPANRIYLNTCGLADVLSLRDRVNIDASQQGDLHAIGQILNVILGVNPENIVSIAGQAPVLIPGVSFSTDFKELLSYLNGRLTPVIAIDDILRLAGSRVFAELDAVRREADLLHSNIRLEMSNGRLARLMCKMNFVTERADNSMDPEWSETGDRYLIKLFRDYVFHLVNENGRPVTDMAHVIGNLNKLDAGSTEKVMLMSRDEKSCLVVSYAEIKRCVEESYKELMTSPKVWK